MTEHQLEQQVERGGRNMARDTRRDAEAGRVDDAFEREEAPRRDSQDASEAAYQRGVPGWPEVEASLRDDGSHPLRGGARQAEQDAAEAHAQRMVHAYHDLAAFLLDLAEERAWASRTGDARDLQGWVRRNAASVVGSDVL